MKFRVTFKDPDGVYESLRDTTRDSANLTQGLSAEEVTALAESRQEELTEFVRSWIKYSEYVTIEFDTELKTATVIPARS